MANCTPKKNDPVEAHKKYGADFTVRLLAKICKINNNFDSKLNIKKRDQHQKLTLSEPCPFKPQAIFCSADWSSLGVLPC